MRRSESPSWTVQDFGRDDASASTTTQPSASFGATSERTRVPAPSSPHADRANPRAARSTSLTTGTSSAGSIAFGHPADRVAKRVEVHHLGARRGGAGDGGGRL